MTQIPIDEALLSDVSRQTGHSKEQLLLLAANLVNAHFQSVLAVLPAQPTAKTQLPPLKVSFEEAAEYVLDKYADAMQELAK
ncbi:MAG: hypothetical protein IGS03_10745 [Candidatus Sericytochromatia bacterium]|nr:hypothetical protein [Candidatus Sericytochromatia bacterium]